METQDTRRQARVARRMILEGLKARPNPWTGEQWREWAAVQAAEVMDRGHAAPRQPDGTYPMDYAFEIHHNPSKHRSSTMVVGPGWNAFTHEVGGRAADYAEVVS